MTNKYIHNINGVEVPFTEEEIAARKIEEAEATNGAKLKQIKQIRLQKLKDTDWWVMRGNMTDAQTTYRQNLRNIPQDYSASDYDALLEMEGEIPNKKLKHTVWSKP